MLELATPSLSVRQRMPVDFATYLLSSSPPASSFDLLSVAFSPLSLAENEAGDHRFGNNYVRPSPLNQRRKAPLKPIIIRSESECSEYQTGSDDSAPQSPQSPGRLKKKVSFADRQGKALATVRVITEPSDMPPKLNPSILSSVTLGATASVTEQPPLKLSFTQPASDYMAFRDKLDRKCVSLENVILKDYDVAGTIKVKNVCFEKSVFVRCTFDNWKTYNDVPAVFIPGPGDSFGRGNIYDTFSFEFSVPTNLEVEKRIEFAACFVAEDRQYWDNDSGSNYQIVFSDYKPKEQPRFVTGPSLGWKGVPSWTEFACWDHVDTTTPYY